MSLQLFTYSACDWLIYLDQFQSSCQNPTNLKPPRQRVLANHRQGGCARVETRLGKSNQSKYSLQQNKLKLNDKSVLALQLFPFSEQKRDLKSTRSHESGGAELER